jgi:hypothetical protein
MPALLNNNKLSEAHQREIVERCNEAYDRGGADALKIVMDTTNSFAAEHPELTSHCAFVLNIVEAVRQELSTTVTGEVHDEYPENKVSLA